MVSVKHLTLSDKGLIVTAELTWPLCVSFAPEKSSIHRKASCIRGTEMCRRLLASYGNSALLKSGVFEWCAVFNKTGNVCMNVILRSVRVVTFAAVVKQYVLKTDGHDEANSLFSQFCEGA